MQDREVMVFADSQALAAQAAELLATAAAQAIAERGVFHLVLSGGSTPRRLYELLATPAWRERVDWHLVHLWWGDERYLPHDHADSNVQTARALLDLVDPAHIHAMPTDEADPQQAARRYAIELGPLGQPPAFDLALMGLGPDGHTASLFPGQAEPAGLVAVVSDSPKPPPLRITLTTAAFNGAQTLLYLVAGADKASAVGLALGEDQDPLNYPTQRIQPRGRTIWLLDQAASAQV